MPVSFKLGLILLLAACALLLPACGRANPEESSGAATPTAENTAAAPTQTGAGAGRPAAPSPSAALRTPTAEAGAPAGLPTAAMTETEDLLAMPLPEGTPLEAWQGIPVMPGAQAGEEGEGSYAFTVPVEKFEVQSFYEAQMAGLGWTLVHTGTSEQGALILLFRKEAETATITVAPQPEGDLLILITHT